MRKQLWMFGLISALALVLMVSPSEAVFVQCPAVGGACGAAEGTTDDADLINGSSNDDNLVEGLGGDDVIFGGPGIDFIEGGEGNDTIFGGLDSDIRIEGNQGNDIILPGPDTDFTQFAFGGTGNDAFTVLASEITTCLVIDGDEDNDVVHLIGFGPYSATEPFGIPNFGPTGAILVIDPITGGLIVIIVSGVDEFDGSETINGLPSPNVTFITTPEVNDLFDPEVGEPVCPILED